MNLLRLHRGAVAAPQPLYALFDFIFLCCIAMAMTANLLAQAPTIITPPQGQVVAATYPAAFSVTATNADTYQWRKDGVNIAGETGTNYAISNVEFSHAGNYSVVISNLNLNGSVTSAPAMLTVEAPLTFITFAGSHGVRGTNDGLGSAARFSTPSGVAVDGVGNLYVSDYDSNTIRKITPAGLVSTLAGVVGSRGTNDGPASAAKFYQPVGMAVDSAGTVYVADSGNKTIRKITPTGLVSTLAAGFSYPNGIVVDSAGNVYVADDHAHIIRKITPAGSVSTIAGVVGTSGFSNGVGSDARFFFPAGMAMDSAGNIYVGDRLNSAVRKLIPEGTNWRVTTLRMGLDWPYGVGVDRGTNVYVAEFRNQIIRRIAPNGIASVVAGVTGLSVADGTGAEARFLSPYSIAADNAGAVYVVDADNAHTIRKGVVGPAISVQPQSQTNAAGSNVALSVTALGLAPLSYRWRFNGTALAGATNTTLALNNFQSTNAGKYSVIVSNALGSVTSFIASLIAVGTPTVLVNGQVPLNNIVVVTNDASLQVELQSSFTNALIYYTINGSNLTDYVAPFVVTAPFSVRAIAYSAGDFQKAEADPVNSVSVMTPGGGNISSAIEADRFTGMVSVNLTAVPTADWTFLNWSGDANGTNTNTVIAVDGPKTVQGFFGTALGTFATGPGGGAVERNINQALYPYGSVVRLSAVPDSTSYFSNWTGAASGQLSPLNFVVTNANTNVRAVFFPLTGLNRSLTVRINGEGTVTNSPQQPNYANNASVTLTATPDADHLFLRWSGDTNSAFHPASNQLSLVMDANKTITATFVSTSATNSPPLAALTSPTDGASFTNPVTIELAATAHDPDGDVTLVQVEFYDGSILLGTVTNAPYAVSWSNASVAIHTLTAQAVDSQGARATSAPISITVATAIPEVVMIPPTNSFIEPANILLHALVSDRDNSVAWVDFFNGAAFVAGVTNPPYQLTWSGVGNGSYLLYAVVHDAYGPVVTSSPPVNVTVGTIATNVPAFYWSNLTVNVNEEGGSVTLYVLKNANSVAANITYSTREGSATAGGGAPDYVAAVSNLAFNAGETVKPVVITVQPDEFYESDHFFYVTLSSPTAGSILGDSEAKVTIIDNDTPGTNSFLGQRPPDLTNALGNLRVSLSPFNILAQWKLSWETDWRNAETILRGMTPGQYEVVFKPIAGYLEPLSRVVAVAGGVTNDFSFAYSNSPASQIGSLVVVIEPPLIATAVNTNARGQWRRSETDPWHDSGERLDGLPAGSYTIEFKTVSDPAWLAPGAMKVAVPANAQAELTGYYYVANTSPGEGPRLLNFEDEIKLLAPPYAFCGQLRTPLGWGSGTVVKEKVVLTAAHVIFDDREGAFVPDSSIKWFFQRHAGVYEPAPQTPRGAIVMSSYAAHRATTEPGVSSPAAQELDVAALHFSEAAGRRGYSGYLVSTADELINAADFGTIVGYPVENVNVPPGGKPGQMHATPLKRILWPTAFAPHVFATTMVKTFPGNSGGPLCIPLTNDVNRRWFPAGIFLGGAGNTVARVIDSAAAALIIAAEQAANDINNSTGGEPPGQPCLSCPPASRYAYLDVYLTPTNIGALGGGYRFANVTNGVVHRDPYTRYEVFGNTYYTLNSEGLPAPQHIAPLPVTVRVPTGRTNSLVMAYKPWGQMAFDGNTFRLLGSSGSVYRIDFSPSLGSSAVWQPMRTQTVASANVALTNLVNLSSNGFLRAVLLP